MDIVLFSRKGNGKEQLPGLVQSFPDPILPATTTLKIDDWGGFVGFKSIITNVQVSANGNYQFLHTLGNNIYVYVFGDRMGQLVLSGLSFETICDDPKGTIGIERVLDYYAQVRLAQREPPIKVTIGTTTTLVGYMTAINAQVVDPKTKMYQFDMQLMIVPPGKPRAEKKEDKKEEKKDDPNASQNEPTRDVRSGESRASFSPEIPEKYITANEDGSGYTARTPYPLQWNAAYSNGIGRWEPAPSGQAAGPPQPIARQPSFVTSPTRTSVSYTP